MGHTQSAGIRWVRLPTLKGVSGGEYQPLLTHRNLDTNEPPWIDTDIRVFKAVLNKIGEQKGHNLSLRRMAFYGEANVMLLVILFSLHLHVLPKKIQLFVQQYAVALALVQRVAQHLRQIHHQMTGLLRLQDAQRMDVVEAVEQKVRAHLAFE